METESGAKIAIRGKGSVKEGKGRSDAAHTSNQEEDLHCLIMADTEEKVNKAKALIHNVIETAASIPEGQNELKRNQLRELAALNGTLRDDENQACQNCKPLSSLPNATLTGLGGQIGHRKYDCPEQRNFTANIICRVCGNAGHMARDCPERQRGTDSRNNVPGNFGPPRGRLGPSDAVDREMEVSTTYALPSFQSLIVLQNLMQELSGNPSNGPAGQIEAAPGTWDQGDSYGGGGDSRPWARPQQSGGAVPWQRERQQDNYGGRDGGAAPAPWAQGRGAGGGDSYGGYGGAPGGGAPGSAAAPWQQQAPPPPPPGGQNYGGYGGYPGYDQGEYGQAPPPPAPPGLSDFLQQYGQQPPPPPSDMPGPPPYNAPPPPPGDVPPPPPPS
jgi:splicing factor 1